MPDMSNLPHAPEVAQSPEEAAAIVRLKGELEMLRGTYPTASNVLLVDVSGCARCGQNHTSVAFRRMLHPIDDAFPWWGLCPTTREPILLSSIAVGVQESMV